MGLKSPTISEKGILTLSDATWKQALLRNKVIAPLSQQNIIGKQAVDEAARQLGLSKRQVYKLVQRYRQGEGLVTDMALEPPSGGKDKGRLPESVEKLIENILQKRYLNRQKRPEVAIWREIAQSCRDLGLKCPALNTVRARIRRLDPRIVARKR